MPTSYLLNTNSKFILSVSNQVFFLTPISQAVPMAVFSVLLNLTSIVFIVQVFLTVYYGLSHLAITATANHFQCLKHRAQWLNHQLRQSTTNVQDTCNKAASWKAPNSGVFSDGHCFPFDSGLQISTADPNSKGSLFSPPPGSCQDLQLAYSVVFLSISN